MKNSIQSFTRFAFVLASLVMFSGQSFANYTNANNAQHDKILYTLINLERERASLLSVFLDTSLSREQKLEKLGYKQRQLADMERMVLRDERLLSSQSRVVQRAFSNYDMTFLVHAGAENQVSAMQQWLINAKLSNEKIMDAKAGYR